MAAGLVDVALGTDTTGSVRVPAAHCGLWALRPTHRRVSTEGVCALAPSYDTVGWFASCPAHLAAVGDVLLPSDGEAQQRDAPPATRCVLYSFGRCESTAVAPPTLSWPGGN